MVKNLKRGDEVITSGGIIVRYRVFEDDRIELIIADNVKVQLIRNTIQGHLKKEEKNNFFVLNFSTTKIVSIYITFLLISFFVLLNFLEIDKSFFKKKINLGLDLQGGSYLLLEVDSKLLEKKCYNQKFFL